MVSRQCVSIESLAKVDVQHARMGGHLSPMSKFKPKHFVLARLDPTISFLGIFVGLRHRFVASMRTRLPSSGARSLACQEVLALPAAGLTGQGPPGEPGDVGFAR